jgi:MoaA/NifB/PqqE/SkfB family radical SAM enzyme
MIQFIGGEPLSREDFPDMADLMKQKRIPFSIITNGTMLDRMYDNLLTNEFCRNIIISLDGPDAETHDSMRGAGVFARVDDNIRQYNIYKAMHPECPTTISINFVPTALNYHKIADMIRYCDQRRVESLSVLEFFNDGTARGKNMGVPADRALEFLLATARSLADGRRHISVTPGFIHPLALDFLGKCYNLRFPNVFHMCGAGTGFCFMDNRGKIYPCNTDRDCGSIKCDNNLISNNFRDVWSHSDFDVPFATYMNDDYYNQLSPCNKCPHLRRGCFPCFQRLKKNGPGMVDECRRYVAAAEQLGVKLLND